VGHRKNKTRYYTFLLVPDDEKAAKSVKFSASFIKFLVVIFVIVFVGIIFGTVTYWKVASLATGYYSLVDENKQLKQSLEQMEEIKADLSHIKKMDTQLRSTLSGYVQILENKENELSDDPSSLTPGLKSRDAERSLYQSIPDILPVDGFITRGVDATSETRNLHIGIDIAAPKGSPIKATADGVVLFAGYTLDEGNVIIIGHKHKIYSVYKHNLTNLCSEMEFVVKGQVIALLGNTGEITSGAHVHFEIWKDYKPVNPLTYIRDAN